MKKYIIMGIVLVSGTVFAQDAAPKLEAVGTLVKATYYFENGNISQEGFFNGGKPEGKWVSYDINGNKKAIGEYAGGQKTGKWFFWNDAVLSEVDYSESRIASVKNWKKEALVVRE